MAWIKVANLSPYSRGTNHEIAGDTAHNHVLVLPIDRSDKKTNKIRPKITGTHMDEIDVHKWRKWAALAHDPHVILGSRTNCSSAFDLSLILIDYSSYENSIVHIPLGSVLSARPSLGGRKPGGRGQLITQSSNTPLGKRIHWHHNIAHDRISIV